MYAAEPRRLGFQRDRPVPKFSQVPLLQTPKSIAQSAGPGARCVCEGVLA